MLIFRRIFCEVCSAFLRNFFDLHRAVVVVVLWCFCVFFVRSRVSSKLKFYVIPRVIFQISRGMDSIGHHEGYRPVTR